MRALQLILITLALTCTPTQAMDLMEAWEHALDNDPDLAAARLDMRINAETVPQARAALLPNISAGASTTDNQRDIQGNFAENFNSHGWSATLTQALFRPSEWFNLQQAGVIGEQARVEFAWQQQQLMLRVAEAYFEVLRAQENVTSSTAEEAAMRSHMERTEERFDVGLIAMTEVHEARAAHDAARVKRVIDEGIVDIRRERLEALIGESAQQQARLDPGFRATLPDPADRETWVQTALASNYALQAARLGVNAAEKGLFARKYENIPTVDFVASYDRGVQGGLSFLGGKVNTTRYALNMDWLIFSGGMHRSRVREAGYRVEQTEFQLDSLQRDVSEDIRILHRQVSTNVLNLQALDQAIRSANAALEATEAGYEVGTRNTVDVLDARRAMFAAERDYANARIDYVLNLLRLKLSAGTLSPADLQALNRELAGD